MIDAGAIIAIALNVIAIAYGAGAINARLKSLEKKVDEGIEKHDDQIVDHGNRLTALETMDRYQVTRHRQVE